MAKTVYSLVLSDDVVREVDRLAYSMNTSRSNMINQILAEYVRMETSEKRMTDIFRQVENLLMGRGSFQMVMRPSDSVMSIRSYLTYKYNPTIRYSIELIKDGTGRNQVQLKILLRSQNQTLFRYMREFFTLLAHLENREVDWEISDTRYIRRLSLPKEEITGEEYGERIARYIQMIDNAVNLFFRYVGEPEAAVQIVRDRYQEYVNKINYIL